MKVYFESLNEGINLSDNEFSDIRREVYNALSDIAFNYQYAEPADLKKAMDIAIEWFQDRFWEIDFYDPLIEDDTLTESEDLSKKDGTIAKALKDNYSALMNAESAQAMKDMVIKLFKDNNIDTPYSKRMIKVEFPKKKNLTQMQFYITNVLQAGAGDAVI